MVLLLICMTLHHPLCITFRYVLASTSDRPAACLPPTEDAFKHHVMRARYQVSLWKQSHLPHPEVWSPIGSGWKRTKDLSSLEPTMFDTEAAPLEVRNLTHLYCTDTNCNVNAKCHGLQSGLTCTELCSCQAECGNKTANDECDSYIPDD